LLETAIVLAITAIGALLVLPLWPATFASAPGPAQEIGAPMARALMAARAQAIAARQRVTVYIDPMHYAFRVDTAGAAGHGKWQELALPLGAGETTAPDDSIAIVTFRPSGAAHGRPIRLRHASGWVEFTVDPWHGEVTRALR
jgi:Tfp pilus assembly protein FimT